MVGKKINSKLRNALIAAAVIVLIFVIPGLFPEKDFRAKYEQYDLSTNIGASSTIKTYDEYLKYYSSAKNPSVEVPLKLLNYIEENSTGAHIENNYRGKDVVYTTEDSSVTWKIDVPEAGFYNIKMEYIGVPSRNVNIERILYINGEMPFSGADTLAFFKTVVFIITEKSLSVRFVFLPQIKHHATSNGTRSRIKHISWK